MGKENESWKSILEKRLYRMTHEDEVYEYYNSGYIFARITKSTGNILFEIGFGIEYRKVKIENKNDLEKLETMLNI